MAFPELKYGRCQVCGGKGKDDPASGSQHSTEDHAGAGYNLIYYEGRLMCKMCMKRLSNDAVSERKAVEFQEDQDFLERSGVRKNMVD